MSEWQGDAHARADTSSGGFGRFLLAWYFIGIFAVISLIIQGVVVTCFFSFPAAVVMLLRNWTAASRREVSFLAIILIVAFGSVMFGFDPAMLGERLKNFVQFSYSIVMIYGLRLELGRATRSDVAAVSGWLLFTIIVAAILEFLGPLRTISDTFRGWNGLVVYLADQRDQVVAGFIRPKVFTQEPSYVAIGVAAFSFVWFNTTIARFRIGFFLLSSAIILYLERSPISFVAFPSVALTVFGGGFRRMRGLDRILYVYLSGIGVIIVFIASLVVVASISAAREQSGGIQSDQSLTVRLVAPPIIAMRVIQQAPIFGAGIGDRKAIRAEVQSVFSDLGIVVSSLNTNVEDAIPNAFWEHWIYLGLVGGTVSMFAIIGYFSSLCKSNRVSATLFVVLFANTFGAYTTPRIWSYVTLVMISVTAARKMPNDFLISNELRP